LTDLDFDSSLHELLSVVTEHPRATAADTMLIIRTLQGRLRLVLSETRVFGPHRAAQPHPESPPNSAGPIQQEANPTSLDQQLQERVGVWFEGPVLSDRQPGAAGGLARHLLAKASPWPEFGWPQTHQRDFATGQEVDLRGGRFKVIDAHPGAAAWFQPDSLAPPWQYLEGKTPPIVSFYSFKGGVGRSTTLAILALMAAREGRRVLVVDLDLEAPGLTPLLLDPTKDSPTPSVLDYLLTATATKRPPKSLPYIELRIPTFLQQTPLFLAPAGHLDANYLQRLSRLDLSARFPNEVSPLQGALNSLLKRLKKAIEPDLIFIDCRTGLSDLGGLALFGLSHAEVLVGREGRQDLEGLALVAQALCRRDRPERTFYPLLTMVQRINDPGTEHNIHRHREYLCSLLQPFFHETLNPTEPGPPYAMPLPYDSEVAGAKWIGAFPMSIWESSHYQAAFHRLGELLGGP
jgi:cellulose biosynthesis protein BcsQ